MRKYGLHLAEKDSSTGERTGYYSMVYVNAESKEEAIQFFNENFNRFNILDEVLDLGKAK